MTVDPGPTDAPNTNVVGQASYSKVGTWPAWLSLDTRTGYAYGTPPADIGVSHVFTTRLTDSFDGSSGTRDRLIYVDGNPVRPSFSQVKSVCALSGGTIDTGEAHLTGTDPNVPITLHNYGSQALPSWLTFNPTTGRITGTVPNDPSALFAMPFSESSKDLSGNDVYMDNGTHYITTYPSPVTFEFPAQTAMGYQAGTYYDYADANQRFRFAMGDGPSFFVSGGTLPPGLTFDSSYWRDAYWLAGTPTVPGTYTFSVTGQAAQCNGVVAGVTRQVTVTVGPATRMYVDVPLSMYARVGIPFRGPKPTIVNPPAPGMKWNWWIDRAFPPGLSVDQGDGSVYGTPTQEGTFRGYYNADNCCAYGYQHTYALDWENFYVSRGPAIAMNDISLPAGTPAGVPPNASGFVGQVKWSGAKMPPGLGVDSATGRIVGTPTTPGSYPGVTVTGTETTLASSGPNDPKAAYPGATSNAFTITVTSGVAIGNIADQARILGQPFEVLPTANGFTGSLSWATVGNLPDGVSIDPATGAITGPGTGTGSTPCRSR